MSREPAMQPPVHSALDLIGDLPLIELTHSETGCRQQLLELNRRNPGGSTRDRPARRAVAEAEQSGGLQPGGAIIEGTAGNTGLAPVPTARQETALEAKPARSELARIVGWKGYAVVTDDGRLVGVVSALDLLRDAGRTGVKEHR